MLSISYLPRVSPDVFLPLAIVYVNWRTSIRSHVTRWVFGIQAMMKQARGVHRDIFGVWKSDHLQAKIDFLRSPEACTKHSGSLKSVLTNVMHGDDASIQQCHMQRLLNWINVSATPWSYGVELSEDWMERKLQAIKIYQGWWGREVMRYMPGFVWHNLKETHGSESICVKCSPAHIFKQKARTHTKCYAAASPRLLLHF